jgi:hypothetical protein
MVNWANSHLGGGIPDVTHDFTSGKNLILLLQAVTQREFPVE